MTNQNFYRPSFSQPETFIWPFLVFVVTGVVFWYVMVISPRKILRQLDKSKKGNENKDLVVSLYLNEVVLRESDFSVIEENLNLFLTICSKTKTYVIAMIPDESKMEVVLSSLESCGAFKSGLAKHRVMFCQLPSGRISMVQQLQPHLHVELDTKNVEFVSTKLLKQNVTTFDNMESLISNQNKTKHNGQR